MLKFLKIIDSQSEEKKRKIMNLDTNLVFWVLDPNLRHHVASIYTMNVIGKFQYELGKIK